MPVNGCTGGHILEQKTRKFHIGRILLCALLLFACAGFASALWYLLSNGFVGFSAILFMLLSDMQGTDTSLVLRYILMALVPGLVLGSLLCFFLFHRWKKPPKLRFYPFTKGVAAAISVLLSLAMIVSGLYMVGFPQWLYGCLNEGKLYEKEYVSPRSVDIRFPEDGSKRNLIYIYLESVETTFMSPEEGGAMEENLMPELTALARENLTFTFSEEGLLGGWQNTNGASWTVGSMVAQTAGVPLSIPVSLDHNEYMSYYKEFLPGAVTLTNILHENGYEQAIMVGSDLSFGGRREYFTQHGMDRVYDLYTAREDGIIPEDYHVWWGYEDLHLFEYAKKVLPELSAGDKPFALTLLTVDTHYVDGYVCELCGDEYEEQYSNVFACSSRQVYDFVQWIEAQDFFPDTTVIICGDHCTMNRWYISRNVPDDYVRRVYNCFINCPVDPARSTGREILPFDMFPTTLAALGCEIEGDRLGLGVNLFSDLPTLAERMGFDEAMDEIDRASNYYRKNFMLIGG